jgi:hypothetical protein
MRWYVYWGSYIELRFNEVLGEYIPHVVQIINGRVLRSHAITSSHLKLTSDETLVKGDNYES